MNFLDECDALVHDLAHPGESALLGEIARLQKALADALSCKPIVFQVDTNTAQHIQVVQENARLRAALRKIATHETGSTVGSEYVGTREVTEDCSECDAMQDIAKAALAEVTP